jgi:hypothetical protein
MSSNTGKQLRILLILGATAAAAAGFAFVPRIPQPESYHAFADQRTFLGVPRGLDVLSNLPFLVVGWMGLAAIRPRARRDLFLDPRERWPYAVFFAGVFVTALGSGWYHLQPSDARLVWDRLPIAVSIMGLLAGIVGERISPTAGRRLLIPLIFVGAGSVFYWWWTETLGRGDLRAYLSVQLFPVVMILLIVWFFPARYTHVAAIPGALGLYIAAKLCEAFDAQIFSLLHLISGHTLKHLFAAAAPYLILQMLTRRSPVHLA